MSSLVSNINAKIRSSDRNPSIDAYRRTSNALIIQGLVLLPSAGVILTWGYFVSYGGVEAFQYVSGPPSHNDTPTLRLRGNNFIRNGYFYKELNRLDINHWIGFVPGILVSTYLIVDTSLIRNHIISS